MDDRVKFLMTGDSQGFYLSKLTQLEELDPLRTNLTVAKYQRDEGFSSEAASIGKQIEATDESLRNGTTSASFKRLVSLYGDAVNREDLTKMITTMKSIESAIKTQPDFIDGLNDLEKRLVERSNALADAVSQRTLAFALGIQDVSSDPFGLSYVNSKIMLMNTFPMSVVDGDKFVFTPIVEPLPIYVDGRNTVPNQNLVFMCKGNDITQDQYGLYFRKGNVRLEYVALIQYALNQSPKYSNHKTFRNSLANSSKKFQKSVDDYEKKIAATVSFA